MQQYQPTPPPLPTTPTPPNPNFSPQPPVQKRRRFEGLRGVINTILILLIAPVLALGITAFIFQSYEVDGPSMNPTLDTKDRLIIWKAGRTWSRITGNDYVPTRGSVIVFVRHGMFDFTNGKEKQLIKRIIGLPGERVVVKNGTITVYNDEHPEGFDPDKTLEYGQSLQETTEGNVDIHVGANELFVVGDNRGNSLDSRSFGSIHVDDIVGTLSARILPLSGARKF